MVKLFFDGNERISIDIGLEQVRSHSEGCENGFFDVVVTAGMEIQTVYLSMLAKFYDEIVERAEAVQSLTKEQLDTVRDVLIDSSSVDADTFELFKREYYKKS